MLDSTLAPRYVPKYYASTTGHKRTIVDIVTDLIDLITGGQVLGIGAEGHARDLALGNGQGTLDQPLAPRHVPQDHSA
jgi:hypothetical protein